MNHKDFTQLIQDAHRRRKRYHTLSSMRLFHGIHDGFDGFFVDRLENHLIVQTHTPQLDALQDVWLDILLSVFSPLAILLKNHNVIRLNRGLTLSDSVLYGSSLNPQIHITEHGHTYSFDLHDPEPFDLIQRPFRSHLSKILPQNPVLLIDPLARHNAPVDADHLTVLPMATKHFDFTAAGTELRALKEQNPSGFDAVALNLTHARARDSFVKSLFHLFFQIMALQKSGGRLILATLEPAACLNALALAGKKLGRNWRLLGRQGQDFDFPVNLTVRKKNEVTFLTLEH